MRMARKRSRRRMGHVQRDILEHLTLGDMLYAHLLSGSSTKRFYQLARERATERYRRKQIVEDLAEMGYLERHGEYISITDKGLAAFGQTVGKIRKLLETQKWDGKWRIVSFDIPERYSSLRDKLRSILKRAGFEKLQHSVWIFPHDCQELVDLIKNEPALQRYVLYGVLEYIEDEKRLKRMFRIK